MVFAEPEFYSEFQCIAQRCKHSCCVGWEIDIDEESAGYYKSLGGELGEKLRRCICQEPAPHFELDANERCPLLNEAGLCELILELGEGSLCDICAEHPRFYNEYEGRSERGIGLCCEEAVRLLLDGDAPLKIICNDDGEAEAETPELILLRDSIFEKLSDETLPLVRRMENACRLIGAELPKPDLERWRKFYLGLEHMNESWTMRLGAPLIEREPEGIKFERLAEYFIYRHFAACAGPEQASLMLQFAFLSVRLIAALDGELSEIVREYSAEIEYSDENIGRITEEAARYV